MARTEDYGSGTGYSKLYPYNDQKSAHSLFAEEHKTSHFENWEADLTLQIANANVELQSITTQSSLKLDAKNQEFKAKTGNVERLDESAENYAQLKAGLDSELLALAKEIVELRRAPQAQEKKLDDLEKQIKSVVSQKFYKIYDLVDTGRNRAWAGAKRLGFELFKLLKNTAIAIGRGGIKAIDMAARAWDRVGLLVDKGLYLIHSHGIAKAEAKNISRLEKVDTVFTENSKAQVQAQAKVDQCQIKIDYFKQRVTYMEKWDASNVDPVRTQLQDAQTEIAELNRGLETAKTSPVSSRSSSPSLEDAVRARGDGVAPPVDTAARTLAEIEKTPGPDTASQKDDDLNLKRGLARGAGGTGG